MRIAVIDIEANGLLLEATTIHCLSYYFLDSGKSGSITTNSEIKKFLEEDVDVIVGHNFITYDMPVIRKLLGFTKILPIIDSLAISWYLYPERNLHGLEAWGESFGIVKPPISDWENLPIETYVYRCEEDVKINTKLWQLQYEFLLELYETESAIFRFCRYLAFKMDCVREQEEIGLKLDVPHVETMAEKLNLEKDAKVVQLESVMPKVETKKVNTYKNAVTDDNGNVFTKGDLFFSALREEGKPIEKEVVLSKVVGWEDPNSNSHQQIKDWLYSLGWVPENIKHVRNKETGVVKQIPQIASVYGGGEICNSIKKLFSKEPKLEVLQGLSVLSHRISIFEGFLRDKIGNRIYASIAGLANTYRFQHRVLVNLPGFTKPYGKEIRSSIVADEGCILFGVDLKNIEDMTKRHYIYKYDPDYVMEMSDPSYDAHLAIGILANLVTAEESDFYKWYDKKPDVRGACPVDIYKDFTDKECKELFSKIKEQRAKAKVTNFSSTYKVGKKTLAKNGGFKESFAAKMLEVFWKKNKAILEVENELAVKTVQRKQWLQNPISEYWYSLRSEKDKFSTLNQGSAVYCFDLFVTYLRKYGIKVAYQCHDEVLFNVPLDKQELFTNYVYSAIQAVNNKLKLNVVLACSIEKGNNYYECH